MLNFPISPETGANRYSPTRAIRNFRAILGTLKGKLTAAVVILVTISSMLVAAVALKIASMDGVEVTGRQQFNLLTSAASHLGAELESKRNLLKLVSEEIAKSNLKRGSIQEALSSHPSLLTSFSNIVVLDSDGWLIADLKTPTQLRRGPYAKRDYFKDTLRERRGVISQPIISSLSGKPVVLITEPVLDRSGKVKFILGGGIDLRNPEFFGQIFRLHLGSSGYLFALTKAGFILHHPDLSTLTKNVNKEAGPAINSVKLALNGWEGWTLAHNKKGVPGILTYKQLKGADWIIGSFVPEDEIFAGIFKARRYAWASTICIAIIAGLIGWATIRKFFKSLRSLYGHIRDVEEEKVGIAVFDLNGKDEVGALSRAVHSLSLKRVKAEQRLKLLSQTDSLTGLPNRRQFDYEITSVIDRANQMQYSIAIGFLDIDNFKTINDTYGHSVGDEVLKEFARRLKSNLRPADRPFRLAGDEFVIIIENVNAGDSVRCLASRLAEAIREPFQLENFELAVTVSMGIAVAQPPMPQAGDFLQHADAALYKTKRAGRDGYTLKQLGIAGKKSETVCRATVTHDH